jgi:hypothetical protein
MIRDLTAAEIETIHDTAVAAVRAYVTAAPDTASAEMGYLSQQATEAVTAAVRTPGIIAQRIARTLRLSGLTVIGMISDPELRAKALVAELHHADRYKQMVRDAQAGHARSWYGQGGVVEKTVVARSLDVSRPTLDQWLASE